MDNKSVASTLERIADLLEIKAENPFKVRAYRNAARMIEGLGTDIRRHVEDKNLSDMPGIGKALEEKITLLVTEGRLEYYEELRAEIPAGVLEILSIPSLGPKKARALWKEANVETLADLRRACRDNRVAGLKGFGKRTQDKIIEGLDFREKHEGKFLLGRVRPVAMRLLEYLRACPEVKRAELAGSLRRWKEVVKDVDLLTSSTRPERVMEYFVRADGVAEVIVRGKTKTSVRLNSGMQVDLRVVADDQFAPALVYFTGSKAHNVAMRGLAQKRGLKINEYGIFRGKKSLPCPNEKAFYKILDLPFIPPEMREDLGEFDLDKIPRLIEITDLKGVLHTHSTWSDGTAEIEAMAEKARSMGLSYMGLSDHSQAASYANGLDGARLGRQMKEVDGLNKRWKNFKILKGLECDILPSGDLDLDPKTLSRLDFVIGSIHSRFDMNEGEMTKRVCKALSNKNLHILGHPTGRLLLARDGFKIDLDQVIEAAKKSKKIIELNANPNRLDLDAPHCRRARERSVKLSINPDAHSTDGLEDIRYGVAVARRAWLEANDVINTKDLKGLRAILRS